MYTRLPWYLRTSLPQIRKSTQQTISLFKKAFSNISSLAQQGPTHKHVRKSLERTDRRHHKHFETKKSTLLTENLLQTYSSPHQQGFARIPTFWYRHTSSNDKAECKVTLLKTATLNATTRQTRIAFTPFVQSGARFFYKFVELPVTEGVGH